MSKVALVDEVLGLTAAAEQRGAADFATTIAASNGMLIPLELLIQARLPANAGYAQAQLLKREYRRKSSLFDADRRILACVCDIVADAEHADTSEALAACIAALAPSTVPRVLTFTRHNAQRSVVALLKHLAPAELVMRIPMDDSSAELGHSLRELREALRTRPATRLVAVLCDDGAASPTPQQLRSLLVALATEVELLCVLPMLMRAGATSTDDAQSAGLTIAPHLEELGLLRRAPGLYAHSHLRVPRRAQPWLNRIMASLPQVDVLGLGPAARSRINDTRFDNHVDADAYARDVGHGGYGIARTFTSSAEDQFIDALLSRLASGSVVDVAALAVRCQCASPHFLDACRRKLDDLRARGALSGKDSGRLVLDAANDNWLPQLHRELGQLRNAIPTITPLARR